MAKYDEDLNENIFFKTLTFEYKDLFRRIIQEKWIICIPRLESLLNYELSFENILNHILVPSDELPETHYQTLCKTQICINNNVLKLNSDPMYDITILFSETYYTEDHQKCEILCLERPIGASSCHSKLCIVQTLRDCIDLLLTESTEGTLLVEKLDQTINQVVSNETFSSLSYEMQPPLIIKLYNKCLDITTNDAKIARKCLSSKSFLSNVKISVESYIQHNVYALIMKGIITNITDELAEFNKILRNMSEVQIQEICINDVDVGSVLKARNELSRLDGYSTILGKYSCLKRSLNDIKKITITENDNLSADELLPAVVFLVIKAGLPTWIAQLKYIKDFNFSQSACYMDELCFLVSMFEAAISYITSGIFFNSYQSNLKISTEINISNDGYNVVGTCNVYRILSKTSNSSLYNMFSMIIKDDLQRVISLLDDNALLADTNNNMQYCHPLCSCDHCEKLQVQTISECKITVDTANEAGITALHVASSCGKSAIVDMLLHRGANPNVIDFSGWTPLHYAAHFGNQSTLLLLMYANSKIDEKDNDGNTALSLATNNGHEDCVKALLYFAEHASILLNVNCTNKEGDTALHQAVRWYYKSIVKILLTYNADVTIKNKYQLTPFDLTQSKHILKLLNDTYHSINLLNIHLHTNFRTKRTNEMDFSDDIKLVPKEEYGIRPHTAECIKKVDKLFKAIKNNDLTLVKYFLGFNEFSCSTNNFKCHPLCRCSECINNDESDNTAFEMDNFVVVKENLNINICNSEGMTALHIASLHGKVDIVRFLLDIGVKPNVRTYRQLSTPLHLACRNQHINIVRMLINTPTCKINLQDVSGNTVLHYACIGGNSYLVEVILKGEPKLDVRNNNAKTPLKEAEDNFSFFIVNLLKTKKQENDNFGF